MCSPTYPIFRSAAVLECKHAQIQIGTRVAIRIGKWLTQDSDRVVELAIATLKDLGFPDARRRAPDAPPRAALDIAAVVDFPVLQFTWKGKRLECRVGITSWYDDRRPKVWFRVGLLDRISDDATVESFFKALDLVGDRLLLAMSGLYNDILARELPLQPEAFPEVEGPVLTPWYKLKLRVVSSASSAIAEAVGEQMHENAERLEQVAVKVFGEEFGHDLVPPPGTRRKVASRIVPFIDTSLMAWESPRDSGRFEPIETALTREADAFDDLKAIVVMDASKDQADVWAVVHDGSPHKPNGRLDRDRRLPFVVSGNLAVELGSLY